MPLEDLSRTLSVRMQDKVALVSGGGSGIGRETSLLFASEGASVIIADLDPDRAAETAAKIISNGGQATQVIGDVSKPNDAKHMVEVSIDAYGKLSGCCPPRLKRVKYSF